MFHRLILGLCTAVWAPTTTRQLGHWLLHLGGVGLIPLGLLDGSIVPLPGSMDVLTIVLSAKDAPHWPYYALMATVGSVIGSFLSYRLARKGGKETLERKLSRRRTEEIFKIFERWGFASIAIPALLPPPLPMVPFVLAAGALRYPVKKFLFALTLGRVVRYSIFAYLGAHYGRHILKLFSPYAHPVVWTIIGLLIFALLVFFLVREIRRQRKPHR